MSDKILVTRSSLPQFEKYVEKIKGIWDSRWLTNNGPIYIEFENKLKKYLECENLELYVNGHMALDISIKALELSGEIITTPFTFASTTHAIVMNGLTPVFCDIKPNDYTIDENKIEELITEKTSAILAVHVYGQTCNVNKLQEICKKHNLKLIFDAAHAFGVRIDNKPIANFGDMSMYSFHATKVFHSIEGGAVIFNDKQHERKLKNLRNFGIEGPESVVEVGINAKMNEFAAAMGSCNLDYIDENIEKRKKVVEQYCNKIGDLDGIKLINYSENIHKGIKENYAYFPIVVDEAKAGFTRDELFFELEKNEIYARKYFYPLITEFECYVERFSNFELPIAKWVSDRVLTLPIYSDLSIDNVDRICNVILSLYKHR